MHDEHRAIAERAHRLWEARGRPTDADEQIWLEAERLFRTEQSPEPSNKAPDNSLNAIDKSLRDSFPASDPPATHLPDEPAANVDEKWRAAGIKRTDATSRTIRSAPKKPPSKRA